MCDAEGALYENGRTPQGVRGLKLIRDALLTGTNGRTPQGVRGLKFRISRSYIHYNGVAPRKGCVD